MAGGSIVGMLIGVFMWPLVALSFKKGRGLKMWTIILELLSPVAIVVNAFCSSLLGNHILWQGQEKQSPHNVVLHDEIMGYAVFGVAKTVVWWVVMSTILGCIYVRKHKLHHR